MIREVGRSANLDKFWVVTQIELCSPFKQLVLGRLFLGINIRRIFPSPDTKIHKLIYNDLYVAMLNAGLNSSNILPANTWTTV